MSKSPEILLKLGVQHLSLNRLIVRLALCALDADANAGIRPRVVIDLPQKLVEILARDELLDEIVLQNLPIAIRPSVDASAKHEDFLVRYHQNRPKFALLA